MNFAKFFIGDYLRDTGTLTLAQHGAYMLMLLEHYATEKPLPTGRELHRLLRADGKAERDAIDFIVAKYWTMTPDGITNARAQQEIEKAAHQRAINQETGKRGGRPKKTKTDMGTVTESVSHSASESQPNENPNHSHSQKNSPLTPGGRTPVGIKTFLDRCKADAEKPVPDDDPVFAYAERVGIPHEFLRLAWREFVDRHRESDKRYRDWRRAFRNCVRSNWYRLWWVDPADGAYQLTTTGVQAQRAHQEATT